MRGLRRGHLLLCRHRALTTSLCSLSSSSARPPQVAVVGSGPAGFYTAQQIIKSHPTARVDVYEKLPVPFGLVRFGVAPDHPEVKNVINTFTQTANQERCTFLGNINIGKDISVAALRQAYTAVVMAYGADEDKRFNLPGEDLNNVLSARSFVGWYNGLPQDTQLCPDLDCETAVVLGQGNVAIDVARILLSPIDLLKKTDITEAALAALAVSRVKRVILIGRRGPRQVAFTIAELREMLRLPGCRPLLDPEDFLPLRDTIKDLPRPRKRLTELMVKSALDDPAPKDKDRWEAATRLWGLRFLRSPLAFNADADGKRVGAVRLAVNALEKSSSGQEVAVQTGETEDIECGMVLRSIGYKSIPLSTEVPFDLNRGVIPNSHGKVEGETGLYCSGWVKTGPVGVIVSTMNTAFETGRLVAEELKDLPVTDAHVGRDAVLQQLEASGIKPVHFEDWEKINQVETARGEQEGRPRKKMVDVDEMMATATA